jgi:hypothetical protein
LTLVTELKAGQRETIRALQEPGILVVTARDGDLKIGRNEYALEGCVFLSDIIPRLSLQQ